MNDSSFMPKGIRGFQKGHSVPEAVRKRVSETHKGRKWSDEIIEKRASKLRGRKSRKRTPQEIENMRQAHLGKKQSAETIAKRFAARKGYKHSDETRLKMSKAQLARRPEGFVPKRPIDKQIRVSFEYKEWRRQVFERDNYTCIWCGQYGGRLQADHIKSFAQYPELRFELSNGRTLCISCHQTTDTYGYKSVVRVQS